MEALEDYCTLLLELGHVATAAIMTGTDMIAVRVKGATHIFRQFVKDGNVATGEVFDENVVSLSDI